ncbi:MAG: nicotinate-nucleotide adenylyltransferase [Betaproteobacteria bacterium]|nr:nicotinate-nucleotide adenylyltransferase [Betaproteobacteria bacterium]
MNPGTGILGGTFDPIHYGHLRMADEVGAALGLAQLRLIPAGNPYHRAAGAQPASSAHRLAMARLGAGEFSRLTVDPREALRAAPSYTVETLTGLREELGSAPLLLLLGADTFATLPTWKRWQELFGLAHIVLVARPGVDADAALAPELADALAARRTGDPGLLSGGAGRIYRQAVTPQPISATRIRELVRARQPITGMAPRAVIEYIEFHNLYRN